MARRIRSQGAPVGASRPAAIVARSVALTIDGKPVDFLDITEISLAPIGGRRRIVYQKGDPLITTLDGGGPLVRTLDAVAPASSGSARAGTTPHPPVCVHPTEPAGRGDADEHPASPVPAGEV